MAEMLQKIMLLPALELYYSNILRCVSFELAIVPIARTSLGMGDGNDMNSIPVMTEYNLERKLLHVARTVPRVDSNEPFGIGLNVRDCDIYGNTEITSSVVTMLRVPIRRCLQFGRCFGMKTNSHRQHRAS